MTVIRSLADLAVSLTALPPMALPTGVLVCPPDHFDVVDVKNPHMADAVGTVDRARAQGQWEALLRAFRGFGLDVQTIAPLAGCEDMVFCANQTLTGLDRVGRRVFVSSNMRHESRRREVPAFGAWLRAHGYSALAALTPTLAFEGGGDALWHPGRRLLWAGHGPRTDEAAHRELARRFDVTVVSLALDDPRCYHLDTCLCLLDERTALLYPDALTESGRALVHALCERVIEIDARQAGLFAGNAVAVPGRGVIIDGDAAKTITSLRDAGYEVVPVATSEFRKSGGSVFCLKQFLF